MSRVAVSELTTYRWSFEEDVQHYREAGIGAIGVWRHKLSDFGEEKGVELLTESGLRVSSVLWAGGFTGSDGRSYAESLQDAREALRLCEMLRCPCLIVYSGNRAGHTHNHARRLLSGALRELVPFAEEHDVTLALEPMHPACAEEWTFLTDLERAVQWIDECKHPRIRLAFDTYHYGFEEGIVERLPALVDRIAIVQLGDARHPPRGEQDRCPLGDGKLPLSEMVQALLEAGYPGDFEVELLGEEIEAWDYDRLLLQSREAAESLLRGAPADP